MGCVDRTRFDGNRVDDLDGARTGKGGLTKRKKATQIGYIYKYTPNRLRLIFGYFGDLSQPARANSTLKEFT